MTHTLTDIYKNYAKDVDSSIDSTVFRMLCSEFNMDIIDHILEGYMFNMGNQLSNISVKRVIRDNAKPTIDWGASNKYKKELLDQGEDLYNKETGQGTKWYIFQVLYIVMKII